MQCLLCLRYAHGCLPISLQSAFDRIARVQFRAFYELAHWRMRLGSYGAL
jgi:hypothetical protein